MKNIEFNKCGQAGFTLLEVMIAMSILTIGILSTLTMAYMSTRNTTSGNVVTQATLLAQARLEAIKNTPDIRDLKDDFPDEDDVIPLNSNGDPMTGGGVFDITYTFTDPIENMAGFDGGMPNCETEAADGSGTCLASVTVSWRRGLGGRGGAGDVRLHTLTHGDGV